MSIIKRKAGSEDIVKSVLEFDEVPTEGSPNLVDSGAVAQAIGNLGKPLQWKGPATVEELNSGIEGIQPGWTYTLTDAGTLTDGSIAVEIDDEVAWTDDDEWFKLGGDTVNAVAIAPEYNSTSMYPILGTAVMQNGKRYVNNVAITIPEDWDPDHWTEKSVEDEIGNVETLLAAL